MRAYVLVSAKHGNIGELRQHIARFPGVKIADICWGLPDIFVVAEVANSVELKKLVMDGIQALEEVERTETHIALE